MNFTLFYEFEGGSIYTYKHKYIYNRYIHKMCILENSYQKISSSSTTCLKWIGFINLLKKYINYKYSKKNLIWLLYNNFYYPTV